MSDSELSTIGEFLVVCDGRYASTQYLGNYEETACTLLTSLRAMFDQVLQLLIRQLETCARTHGQDH